MPAEEKMRTLPEIFENHRGLPANKFPHHIQVYDELFHKVAERVVGPSIVEIGIGHGGSLQMWREYFGPNATVIGIDVQDLAYLQEPTKAKIYQLNQGDRASMDLLRDQLGSPHIIIDDGSHICGHQILTFETLFPILMNDGYYIIEDIHTSYRSDYNFGGSFVEYLKKLADDIHSSELGKSPVNPNVFSVSIYPNLAVIQKRSPATWGGATVRPAERIKNDS